MKQLKAIVVENIVFPQAGRPGTQRASEYERQMAIERKAEVFRVGCVADLLVMLSCWREHTEKLAVSASSLKVSKHRKEKANDRSHEDFLVRAIKRMWRGGANSNRAEVLSIWMDGRKEKPSRR